MWEGKRQEGTKRDPPRENSYPLVCRVSYRLAKEDKKCVVEKASGVGAAQQVQLERLSRDQQGGSKFVRPRVSEPEGVLLKKHLGWRDMPQLIKN